MSNFLLTVLKYFVIGLLFNVVLYMFFGIGEVTLTALIMLSMVIVISSLLGAIVYVILKALMKYVFKIH